MNAPPQLHTNFRAAVGAQEPVTWIEIDGRRLAAMRRGRGKPILCLHAIGHGARDFEEFAGLVGDTFEIIALDWPGQGLSPPDGAAPTAEHYEHVLRARDGCAQPRARDPHRQFDRRRGRLALRGTRAGARGGTRVCDTGGLVALTRVRALYDRARGRVLRSRRTPCEMVRTRFPLLLSPHRAAPRTRPGRSHRGIRLRDRGPFARSLGGFCQTGGGHQSARAAREMPGFHSLGEIGPRHPLVAPPQDRAQIPRRAHQALPRRPCGISGRRSSVSPAPSGSSRRTRTSPSARRYSP